MSKLEYQKKLFQRSSIEEFLAPRVYNPEDEFFLLDEGVMGFGFLTNPLVYANDSVASDLTTLFNGWFPEHAIMSFSIYASEDIKQYTQYLRNKTAQHRFDRQNDNVKRVLDEIATDRADFIEKKAYENLEEINGTKAKRTYAYVTCSFPMNPKDLTDEMYDKLINFKSKVSTSLKQAGMSPRAISPEDVIHIMSTILNTGEKTDWVKGTKRPYMESEFIKDQVVDENTKLKRETEELFWVGSEDKKRYVKVMSCKRFPEEASISSTHLYFNNPMDKGKGVFDNCIITSSLYFPPKNKEKGKIQKARAWADNQKSAQKWRPLLGNIANSYDILFGSISGDNRPVKISFSIALFNYDKKALEQSTESLRTYYDSSGIGLKMSEESVIGPGVFFSMLPFGQDPDPQVVEFMGRHVSMSSLEVPHIIPICSDWTGNGEPVLQMFSRGGELMGIDFWGSDTNFNVLLSAASGSGKSVLGQNIVNSYAAIDNALIYIADLGNSYKNITEKMDGNYFDFDQNSKYNFSPFAAIQDIDQDLEFTTSIFEVMASQKNPLSDYEYQELKDGVRYAFTQKGRNALVDDVQEYLFDTAKERDEKKLFELAVRLKEFSSKGSYKNLFSGDNYVDFGRSQLNVFELGGLDKQETLQAVILYMILAEIKRSVFEDMDDPIKRGRKKIIIIDEGWSLISRGEKAIYEFYRTFRKANASIILITQNMMDIVNEGGPAAKTLFDNSANKYFLGMEDNAINGLRESGMVTLSPYEWNVLSGVKTEKGHYSEIFFATGRGQGVGRLINSRFNMLLTSTDATDVKMIYEVQQSLGEGATYEDSIREIVKREEFRTRA